MLVRSEININLKKKIKGINMNKKINVTKRLKYRTFTYTLSQLRVFLDKNEMVYSTTWILISNLNRMNCKEQ